MERLGELIPSLQQHLMVKQARSWAMLLLHCARGHDSRAKPKPSACGPERSFPIVTWRKNKPSPFLQHMILAQTAVWWLWRWHDKRAEITHSVDMVTRVLSPILPCCSGELNCSFQGRSLTSLYNFSSRPSSQVLILHSLETVAPLLLPLSVTPRQSFVILIFQISISEWGLWNSLLPNSRWNFGNIVKVLML